MLEWIDELIITNILSIIIIYVIIYYYYWIDLFILFYRGLLLDRFNHPLFMLLLFHLFLLYPLLIWIIIGLKYLAAGIPITSLTGVAIGIGIIFGCAILSLARNSIGVINDIIIRWSFIAMSLVEVSGFIAIIFSFIFWSPIIILFYFISYLLFYLLLIVGILFLLPFLIRPDFWVLHYLFLFFLIIFPIPLSILHLSYRPGWSYAYLSLLEFDFMIYYYYLLLVACHCALITLWLFLLFHLLLRKLFYFYLYFYFTSMRVFILVFIYLFLIHLIFYLLFIVLD